MGGSRTARPPLIPGARGLIDTGADGLVATLVAAAFISAFFDLEARREEAWLLAAYPGYAAYRERVPKLVPFIY